MHWHSFNMWVCDFVSGVWQAKTCATVQAHLFLSPICRHLLAEQKLPDSFCQAETYTYIMCINLYIYNNQKFIQDDLDETMTMWTDAETIKCFSIDCLRVDHLFVWTRLFVRVRCSAWERITEFVQCQLVNIYCS